MEGSETCLTTIKQNFHSILEYSGRYLLQSGQFIECTKTQNYQYNWVTFGAFGINLNTGVGICLPNICSNNDINTTLTSLFHDIRYPIYVQSIAKIENNQNQLDQNNLQYYLFIIITTIIVLVSLCSSFIDSKQQKNSYIQAFNVKKNIFKYFQRDHHSSLNILNGIRSIAMMWIVLGHTFSNFIEGSSNYITSQAIFSHKFTLMIYAGVLSVDIFFFLSGFLFAFAFFKAKNTSHQQYFLAILHRALRIWPSYLFTMIFFYIVYPRLGSGPFWNPNQQSVNYCSKMWHSLLFFANFYKNGQQICAEWTWYLQIDFQLFLLSIFLLLIYSKTKNRFYIITIILLIFTSIYNILYTQLNEIKMFTSLESLQRFGNYFLDVQSKPYGRIATYLIGLICGIVYYQQFYLQNYVPQKDHQQNNINNGEQITQKNIFKQIKVQLQKRKYIRVIVQWLGLFIMLIVIIVPRNAQIGQEYHQIWHSLYLYNSKIIFIAGLVLIIFPTIIGVKGSIFSLILDTSLFNFISKISFSCYLVHLIIIYVINKSRKVDYYFTIQGTLVNYLGILIYTVFFGFLLTIFVEMPCNYLQRTLIMKIKEKQIQYQRLEIQESFEEINNDKKNQLYEKQDQFQRQIQIIQDKNNQSSDFYVFEAKKTSQYKNK